MGRQRERHRQDDRVAMALEMIRQTDARWYGLAVWLSRAGMDRDAELLDRLAARAERMARNERYRAEASASRRRDS
jgi:hypothetical protein